MVTESENSSQQEVRKTFRVKESFLYSKIVPVALAVLVVALLAVMVIVGLSLIGATPGG